MILQKDVEKTMAGAERESNFCRHNEERGLVFTGHINKRKSSRRKYNKH